MNTLIIFCAKYLIIVPILTLGWILFKEPKAMWKRNALYSLAVLIIAFVLAKVASHFYLDPRPFVVGNFAPLIPHAADNGFPSDHMLLASALAAITLCFKRKAGIALWIIALIIGTARVYAGVHHPTDIIVSALIAILAGTIVHIVFKRRGNAILSA